MTEASVIGKPTSADKFLHYLMELYRSRKPEVTNRCIIREFSCSKRFENSYKTSRDEGKNPLSAFLNSVNQTITTCCTLNRCSRSKAAIILIGGTSLALLGITSACNPDDYGCPPCCPPR